MRRATRAVTVIASVGLLATGLTGAATGEPTPPEAKAPGNPVYFVHGWGDGKGCEDIWGNAVDHFDDEGWDSGRMYNLRYYEGDHGDCDVEDADIRDEAQPDDEDGDPDKDYGSKETRIYNVAAAFAHRIYDEHTSKNETVDIVAHSMGGLVTRVALLGTAQGWDGFPDNGDGTNGVLLDVDDVVTLGTPHQGVIQKVSGEPSDTQWVSMDPDERFMEVLHAEENELPKWSSYTDWSFVGSNEDDTVTGESAIDKGGFADHKYLYRGGNKLEVTHTKIRSEDGGDHHFTMRHWHASDSDTTHDTEEGRSPVALAYRAVTSDDR